MTSETTSKDQLHPLRQQDRQTVDRFLKEEATDFNLVELGRLLIRYRGFPGARDLQADLKKALERWGLTEETLYEKTRAIHETAQVYRGRNNQREDWS